MKKEKERLCGDVAFIGVALEFPRYRCHESAFLRCVGLRLLRYKSAVKVSGIYRCFKGKPIHHSWVRWKRYLIETDPKQVAGRGNYPNDPMVHEILGVIDDKKIIQRYEIRVSGLPNEKFNTLVYKEAEKLRAVLKSLPNLASSGSSHK